MKVSDIGKVPVIGTFYSVILLDASGSMSGAKYSAACEGIKEELINLRKEGSVTKTVVTICEFEGEWRTGKCMNITTDDLNKINFVPMGTGGSTPLYATVGYQLEKLLEVMGDSDSAVMKIFTDGAENSSSGSKYASHDVLHNLIAKAEERGVVVTFIGTTQDIRTVVRDLGIKIGNTLSHNNTAEDITRGMGVSYMSTSKMRSSYSSGESIKGTTDFFSNNESK